MLWPLSWDDDNWQSMLHILGVNNHALSIVMRRWKLTEHVSYLWNTLLCSDRCHETMVTDRAWFIPHGWITMLWLLSLDDDNKGSLFHALNTFPFSDHCHETVATDGACYIPEWISQISTVVMRWWQLTKNDSYLIGYHHTLTVVIRRWKPTDNFIP